MSESKDFRCALCGESFTSTTPDEEAWQEYDEVFPNEPQCHGVLTCDDCYWMFRRWFASLTPEERQKLRDDDPMLNIN